jgi:hypothetical protein
MHAPVRVERVSWFGRIVREPLVHFLLIGLFLFALYGLVGGRTGDRMIRVDDNVAAALHAQFSKTWQRPPTAEEMNGLVNSYVRDEIFYREGVTLGMDKDDPTIKRRVSQKFATIAEEWESSKPPTDAELEQWLKQHPARYAEPSLITFDQVMFASPAAFQAGRKALAAGADPQQLGEGRMLLPHFELYPVDIIQRDFGPEFARSLLSVRPGDWQGPVRSGYGVHLVRVEKIVPGRTPKLADVRPAVVRDFEQARRNRSLDGAFRKLRQSYRVEYSGEWKPRQER